MKFWTILVVLVLALLPFGASAQDEVAAGTVRCNRTVERYFWWAEVPLAGYDDVGYVAKVIWTVPAGEPECIAVYQIEGSMLEAVQGTGVTCSNPAPNTIICGDPIAQTATASVYGRREPNFVTDSVTTWFYWTYRFLLPITPKSA